MHKSSAKKKRRKHVVVWVREQLDLTQSELADLIDASRDTIQSIEIGRLPLSERFAYAIAEQTGFHAKFLLANKIPNPCPPKSMSLETFQEAQTGRWKLGFYMTHLIPRSLFVRAYVLYRAVFNEMGYTGGFINGGGQKLLLKFVHDLLEIVPKKRRKAIWQGAREIIAPGSEQALSLLLADIQELRRALKEHKIQEQKRAAALHDAA